MKRRVSGTALLAITLAGSAWADTIRAPPTAQGEVQHKNVEWTVTYDASISVNPTWWSTSLAACVAFGASVDDDRRFGLTLGVDANDAYVSPAISIEWRVASPWSVLLEYRGFGFYGRNGALLDFRTPSAPYGDDAIDALIGTAAETSGYGQRVALAEKLHATAGAMIFAVEAAMALYNLASQPGAYLDWETDKLLREVDGLLLLRGAVLIAPYRSKAFELATGAYAETTAAERTRLVRQRVGGLLVMRMDRLRFGMAVGVDALDPNRQGQMYGIANIGVDLP